jgi:hypothetical protein
MSRRVAGCAIVAFSVVVMVTAGESTQSLTLTHSSDSTRDNIYADGLVLMESRLESTDGGSRFVVVRPDTKFHRGSRKDYVFILLPADTTIAISPGQTLRAWGSVKEALSIERGARAKIYDHLFGLMRQVGALPKDSAALSYLEARQVTSAN